MACYIIAGRDPFQVPRLCRPLYSTSLNLFQLAIFHPCPFTQNRMSLGFISFIWSSSIPALPKVFLLTFSNTRHSQSICIDVSFCVPYFLHDGDFTPPSLCRMYLRLTCPHNLRLLYGIKHPTYVRVKPYYSVWNRYEIWFSWADFCQWCWWDG